MAGEAAVSDPIGLALAWAASLASIAVAVVAAGHAGVYTVIRSRPRRGDCSSAAALPSRSLAIRSRDGAAHLFTCSSGNSTFEEQGPWLGDAGRQLIVGTLFDISSRKEIEQQLLRMVITDPFASRLREHVRATDMAARIGGRNSLCCWKRHR